MISIKNKSLCCGCGACEQICPQKCIVMTKDEEGFLYPVVKDGCVNCNMCNTVCPVRETVLPQESYPASYGVRHKDESVRRDSSSGGAFTLLAESILHANGIVFGCALDEKMHAVHIGVEKIEDLAKLRGSKYVQSDIGETYRKVKAAVKAKREVMFVGTPCQAAGLYSYMENKVYDNLYIVDFICHGVPSPMVFNSFIEKQEKKKKRKIISHKFRNKRHGWSQTGLQLGTESIFDDGSSVHRFPALFDSFMNGFLDDVYLRPSCYDCKFKTIPKEYADFTIADFWGVNKVAPDLNDNKGTSLVMVNTSHGKALWDKVKGNCVYQNVDFEKAIKRNKSLVKSVKLNPDREAFFQDYYEKGFEYVEKKYMSTFSWVSHKLIKILREKYAQFIKFSLVGCSNTLINLSVYYLSIYLGMHYIPAYILGFSVSVCNSFYWNNKYVFKNKQELNMVKAFVKVLASYGVSFLLSVILMSVLVEIIGISSYVAPILKIMVTFPLNFILNKLWAFRERL